MKSTTARRTPPRIAYLVHEFDNGGIERNIVNLANHLKREQFEPIIVCITKSGKAAQSLTKNVEIFEIRKKPGWSSKAIWRLSKILREQRVTILHSNNWGTLIEGSIARHIANTPVHIHTEHGQGLHTNLRPHKRILRKILSRLAFENLNEVCVCARSVAPLVSTRTGFAESRMRLLSNGVPQPKFTEANSFRKSICKQFAIPIEAHIIGTTGRLVPIKGFDLAIRAIQELTTSETKPHLILVGDGESRAHLTQLSSELGISDRVHFPGHQTDVGPWLQAFDLFLNTSHSEAMSLSILEALACGIPVIATDVGDNRRLLLDMSPCGRVIEEAKPLVLAKEIESLLQNPTLRAEYSNNGRSTYLSKYSVQSMLQNHIDVYLSHCY